MYGYDLLHIHDEISMFLTISTKNGFGLRHVYFEFQKPNRYFSKWKSFYENTNKSWVCVCICTWAIHQLFFPLQFLSKNKILTKTNLDTSLLLKYSLEVFFSFLTWSKLWSKELDSSWVLDVVLMHKLLNQYVLAPKLDFKSFIEAKHLLRSWSQIWD